MAQNFVGKNNINLLKPIGQYGTRNLNGKDHASHRYLNTELSSLTTSYLFCNVDDEILDYELAEDGKTIEPKCQGVGIGWSSVVPKYNPQDIINNIRCKLKGESVENMTPWYKGFNGTIVATKNTWYHTDGLKFEQIGDGRTVGFHIEFMPGKAPTEHDDLITTLQLRTKISTNIMHLYNNIDDIEKFNSATNILEEFYETRLGYYKMRHNDMSTKIESDLEDLISTRNFVEFARNQKFDFVTKDSKDLQEFFMVHNVADVSIRSLLSLPLSNFLNEGLRKLEDKITEKEKEKNALIFKKETQLWEDDLNAFEVAWKKEEASWEKSDTMSCPICDGVACIESTSNDVNTTPTIMEPRRSHRLKKPNPKYPPFLSLIH
ncbi:DNA topoisomerase 2-like [Trifolium pratense]|uniref:DNA topoisomerase 2-like n=1 Tax=Trifolium pratense TaxID=57577 RepID=UPI001E69112C|nr:DNA topoisomerase 2-like [Trifolium pratense]